MPPVRGRGQVLNGYEIQLLELLLYERVGHPPQVCTVRRAYRAGVHDPVEVARGREVVEPVREAGLGIRRRGADGPEVVRRRDQVRLGVIAEPVEQTGVVANVGPPGRALLPPDGDGLAGGARLLNELATGGELAIRRRIPVGAGIAGVPRDVRRQ